MIPEFLRKNIIGPMLVFGLIGAIVSSLLATGQSLGNAWLEVVGPSKFIALALIAGLYAWLPELIRIRKQVIGVVLLLSIVMSRFVPIEYWAVALLSYGLWSASRDFSFAPTLIALSAIGLHIALVGGQFSALLSFALHLDTALTAALIELSGRPVIVQDTLLIVEEGISLRLIGPCSSIWPILTVIGAIGAALGAMRLGSAKSHYIAMGFGALAVLCLNGLRLAAMSTSSFTYEWLHAGEGAVLFRMLILATIVVPFAFINRNVRPN